MIGDVGTVTRTEGGGFILNYVRKMEQPRAKVWAALTDPAITKYWLGETEADLRVGGHYIIRFKGSTAVMTGRILRLEPEQLLEHTWLENYGMPESVVRWTLSKHGDGCRLVLTHILPPGCKPEDIASFGAGWQGFLASIPLAIRGESKGGFDLPAYEARTKVYLAAIEAPMTLAIDGNLEGDTSIRFDRALKQPVEKVWAALVEPAVLANWLGDVEVEPRVGGKYAIRAPFEMNGAITVFEPHKTLEYTWVEDIGLPPSHVRWELAPSQEGCRLTLTHSFPKGLRRADLVPFLGGWEAFLDAITEGASGTKVPNIPYEPYDVQYRAKYPEGTP